MMRQVHYFTGNGIVICLDVMLNPVLTERSISGSHSIYVVFHVRGLQ